MILILLGYPGWTNGQDDNKKIRFDFYGDTIEFPRNRSAEVTFNDTLSYTSINTFYERICATDFQPVIDALLAYREKRHPDDWVYYQLVRRTAQSMSPKADNYFRYTLYKWFLLNRSGYDATLNIVSDKLLFYVQSDDEVFDIPYFMSNDKKYVCLNYHDYGYHVDFEKNRQVNVAITVPGEKRKFSYKLTRLPGFHPESYHEKELQFTYHEVDYQFRVKINDEVKKMFVNYPVTDYQLYFDEPLSGETYNTLIPQLKKHIATMSVKQGVDYLMHFTRYAFSYAPDKDNFGREKHLSPEQTLLYDSSDCEDRSALFYCLVKEIYNLPMVVVAFPHHLTIAVKLDKPVGRQIVYNGMSYSVCEPTPQADDLPLGKLSRELNTVPYEVAYSYTPPSH